MDMFLPLIPRDYIHHSLSVPFKGHFVDGIPVTDPNLFLPIFGHYWIIIMIITIHSPFPDRWNHHFHSEKVSISQIRIFFHMSLNILSPHFPEYRPFVGIFFRPFGETTKIIQVANCLLEKGFCVLKLCQSQQDVEAAYAALRKRAENGGSLEADRDIAPVYFLNGYAL